MCMLSYGFCLSLVAGLWSLWFVVLCLERRWFREIWRGWRNMSPSSKAAMAVFCAYCTVTAQKPTNVTGGAASALPTTGTLAGASAVLRQPDPPPLALSEDEPQGEPLSVQAEPVRIVFQATFATDPRAVAAFTNEPGWSAPLAVAVTPALGALSFAGGATNPASPVCFSGTEAVTVQTLMIAARGEAADLATLVDAPETARLRLIHDGGQPVATSAVEQSLTDQFIPQQWQLVAVDFGTPAPLAGLFFGGTAGRPAWDRRWRGELAEVVGFSAPPDAELRAGVANYLSIRWGLGSHPATPEQRAAAISAGLRYGLVWGSVLIVK